MEKTYKRVPFDIELAKKIQAGEVEGKIVCNLGTIRIIEFDLSPIPNTVEGTIFGTFMYGEKELLMFDNDGICTNRSIKYNLFIILSEEPKEHEFKPFDKVLVRDCEREHPWWTPAIFQEANVLVGDCEMENPWWTPAIFQETDDYPAPYMASGLWWKECIPYEGNEYLVGTTDNPKEERVC